MPRLARLSVTKLAPDPVEVELCESWESYREFWTVMLAFAVAQNADAVYYRLSETDECLGVEVGEKLLTLHPPPLEYRRELLDAIRQLTYRRKWRLAWLRFIGLFARETFVGGLVLETEFGDVTWEANAFADRIMLRRVRESVAAAV